MQSDVKYQAPNFFHLHLILVTKDYQNVLYLSRKPQPNDNNISTQHIPTLLAQHLQAPPKLSNISAQHVPTLEEEEENT